MPKPETPDDKKELALHALEGAAWVALGRLAYKLAKDGRLQSRGVEGDDLLHTAYAKILGKSEQFRGESAFSTYAYRVVINVFKDMADKLGNEQQHTVDLDPDAKAHLLTVPDTSSPEQTLILKEERNRLLAVIKTLSDPEQVVIWKQYFEDMRLEDIAAELDMPLGTVKNHASRAREKLRKKLEGEKAA